MDNCDTETVEKLLAVIEMMPRGPMSGEDCRALRGLFGSDKVISREMSDYQASPGLSLVALILGVLSLAAYMYFMGDIYQTREVNTMEVAQISTTISWCIVTVILFSYTWGKSSTEASIVDDPASGLQNEITGITPEDMKNRLKEKLL